MLAAGHGTRLRPLTDVLPKCLAPIRGRPLIEYWLTSLADAGFDRIVVNTHYRADLVEAYVAASPFAERVELVREPELLGTGGTLVANAERFDAGPLLVAHADNLTVFDPERFLEAHRARPPEAVLTMMTFATDTPRSCGIVTTDDRGLVDGFFEKVDDPPGNRANAAVYLVEPEVIAVAAESGRPFVDLSTEVLPRLIGRMATWHNDVYHRDIGSLDAWRLAQRDYCGPVPSATAAVDPWSRLLEERVPEAEASIARLLEAEPTR